MTVTIQISLFLSVVDKYQYKYFLQYSLSYKIQKDGTLSKKCSAVAQVNQNSSFSNFYRYLLIPSSFTFVV